MTISTKLRNKFNVYLKSNKKERRRLAPAIFYKIKPKKKRDLTFFLDFFYKKLFFLIRNSYKKHCSWVLLSVLEIAGIAGRHRKGRGPVRADLAEPRPRLTAWLDTFSVGERQVGYSTARGEGGGSNLPAAEGGRKNQHCPPPCTEDIDVPCAFPECVRAIWGIL